MVSVHAALLRVKTGIEEGYSVVSSLIIKSSHGRGFIRAALDDNILWNATERMAPQVATEIDGETILPSLGNTRRGRNARRTLKALISPSESRFDERADECFRDGTRARAGEIRADEGSQSVVHANFAFDPMNKGAPSGCCVLQTA